MQTMDQIFEELTGDLKNAASENETPAGMISLDAALAAVEKFKERHASGGERLVVLTVSQQAFLQLVLTQYKNQHLKPLYEKAKGEQNGASMGYYYTQMGRADDLMEILRPSEEKEPAHA